MRNFQAKLNACVRLLRACSLYQSENKYPKIPDNIASICRGKTYSEVWRFLLSESYFRILLNDYGFLMFNYEVDRSNSILAISMSYYGCPYDGVSIEDYIAETYGEEYLSLKYDPEIKKEYEQSLNDSRLLEWPVTFRYDYSPDLYEPGRHPASHLHIGFQNEIRLGCKRILDPLSFTVFVIRQQYPEIWKPVVLQSHTDMFKSSVRDSLQFVPETYISGYDKFEMYLD